MEFARPVVILGLTVFVSFAGALVPTDATAQQIFRFIGPDGRVTFSDRPQAGASSAAPTGAAPSAGNNDVAALPFELRQAATSYPVTLFSGPECAPCMQGRAMLTSRGIPFAEKTVTTNEDIEALKRLVGIATLPVVTIGGQQLTGYSEIEWAQYLDAAGYPKTSQLPAAYRRAPASPLVVAHEVKPVRQAPPAPEAPAPVPVVPAPSDGGFQF